MKISFLLLLIGQFAFGQIVTPSGNKLNCANVIDFQNYKGTTFLNFMEKTGKPLLDKYANEGYPVKSPEEIYLVLDQVSSKVSGKVSKATDYSKSKFKSLLTNLSGQTVNLYNLPAKIMELQPEFNPYDLSTFIGLASCGGLIMKYAEGNYAYNIHYGTGLLKSHNTPELKEMHRKDKQTGRSFGEGPTRNADDASDKAYLTDLEEYASGNPDDLADFYRNLLIAVGNNDTTEYLKMELAGQTVLTDFLAVYTAEQARNLMDRKVDLHWDAALLEVTLLAAFHAGQTQLELFYKDPNNSTELIFTSSVLNQAPCRGLLPLPIEGKFRSARLYDYWQFSSSADEENCKRSGINITKQEFRKLGSLITKFVRLNNPKLIYAIEKNFHRSNRKGKNIFLSLSKHFINPKTPKKLGKNAYNLAESFTALLTEIRLKAPEITVFIKEKHKL